MLSQLGELALLESENVECDLGPWEKEFAVRDDIVAISQQPYALDLRILRRSRDKILQPRLAVLDVPIVLNVFAFA
jgi:hypothetical protein